ncbi:hypothetical protein MES5069_870001 [Mesorhizobium escarrei]|uniref:Uncharacterized protein n=1 Tax=Mesorhizobium escarrei TaxID=666018 RepID=A0ABM9EKI2_9HYPH|nr:hypothetical protein MES5069_870001 [Mesorhizobium escarrei]
MDEASSLRHSYRLQHAIKTLGRLCRLILLTPYWEGETPIPERSKALRKTSKCRRH